MSWLSGERSSYKAEDWTNRFHPTGHFGLAADGVTERSHTHTAQGVQYLFDRSSFRLFGGGAEAAAAADSEASTRGGAGGLWGMRVHPRLHLVTSTRRRAGQSTLRPISSKVNGYVQHRAARDLALVDALLRPEAAAAYDWEALRSGLRAMSGPLSPLGALQLFAADEAAAERLHVECHEEQE